MEGPIYPNHLEAKIQTPIDVQLVELRNIGGTSNLVANLIESQQESLSAQPNLEAFIQDVKSIALEDAIREAYKTDYYELTEEQAVDLSKIMIPEKNVHPASIPYFNKSRNSANNYNNWKFMIGNFGDSNSGKFRNDYHFIEISPTPKPQNIIEMEEFLRNGYTQHDYIQITKWNPNSAKFENRQLWIDSKNDIFWKNIINSLREEENEGDIRMFGQQNSCESPEYSSDIISKAGFLSTQKIDVLLSKFDLSQQQVDHDIEEIHALREYYFNQILNNPLTVEVRQEMLDPRNYTSKNTLSEDCINRIRKRINILIHNTMIDARLMLIQHYGKSVTLEGFDISLEKFRQGTEQSKYKSIINSNIQLIPYCGGTLNVSNSFLGGASNSGLNLFKVLGEKSSLKPDLSEPCDNCGARWYINEKDSNTWEKFCPGCGRHFNLC